MQNRFLLFFSFIILSSSTGCTQNSSTKINGVSLVAAPDSLLQKHVTPLLEIGSNYASIMPFGFIKNTSHPQVVYNTQRQWFGETKEGAKQYIQLLQKNDISVMMKPQIWIWRGEYTGLLEMTSEEHWVELEQSYSAFILEYAQVAQETHCTIFCIGTELELFIKNRPEYWKKLIAKIRTVYSGKLTYAANWDEYKRVAFWDQLDYIGIDAYFPVSHSKTPIITELKQGWEPWKIEMKTVSKNYNKPVLFTEYGYRSTNFTGKEPWNIDRNSSSSNELGQANALRALYSEIWSEEWFAGGFIWKWYHNHQEAGGTTNNRFTPQNKQAEIILKNQYKNGS